MESTQARKGEMWEGAEEQIPMELVSRGGGSSMTMEIRESGERKEEPTSIVCVLTAHVVGFETVLPALWIVLGGVR